MYPFLDDSYKEHVGKPLSEIPCPCGGHESYSEHFLEPFLLALEELGIEHTTLYVHKMYKNGQYADVVKTAMDKKEEIKDILANLSGREMAEDWWPYTLKCGECGKMGQNKITGYEWPKASYQCKCGFSGEADLRGDGGKLPWRVEWPARWHHLGVTCEPFGKDHATRGGSYETGKAIIEQIYGGTAPHPVVYEWIQLKGKGAMSSSSGVVVTAVDMLSMTPPEVMRFLIAKYQANKHIDFDPGLGILNLVDEYDHVEQVTLGTKEPSAGEEDRLDDLHRVYELSQPGKVPDKPPMSVPYRHFVSLVQIADDWPGVKDILLRTMNESEFSVEDEAHLQKRSEVVRFWLDYAAPDMVKFSLQKEPPVIERTEDVKQIFAVLSETLDITEWKGGDIHDAIYEASEKSGIPAKKLFKMSYRALIDQPRGPRLGFFLSTLDKEWVLDRFKHYLGD